MYDAFVITKRKHDCDKEQNEKQQVAMRKYCALAAVYKETNNEFCQPAKEDENNEHPNVNPQLQIGCL
ncbi:hypothetical protein D3C77_670230 [compost metagenome]